MLSLRVVRWRLLPTDLERIRASAPALGRRWTSREGGKAGRIVTVCLPFDKFAVNSFKTNVRGLFNFRFYRARILSHCEWLNDVVQHF